MTEHRSIIIYTKDSLNFEGHPFQMLDWFITGRNPQEFTKEELENFKKKIADPKNYVTMVPLKYNTVIGYTTSESEHGKVDFIGKFSRQDKRSIRRLIKTNLDILGGE